MKIVTFFNVKGGVGKTTLSILTALKLSKENKRILLIDADTQANITQFIYKVFHQDKTLFDALTDNTDAKDIIIKSPIENYLNVDLIPSDLSLSVLSEVLTTKTNREKSVWKWFKSNIEVLKKYDYIFIDLSPSYDLIARNFMIVSDSIITPLCYQDIASVRGCELFYQKFNEDLEDLEIEDKPSRGVVINSYTSRNLSSATVFNDYLDSFDNIKRDLLESKISDTTVIKNAILEKLSVDDYLKNKNHKVKQEIESFIDELKRREIL